MFVFFSTAKDFYVLPILSNRLSIDFPLTYQSHYLNCNSISLFVFFIYRNSEILFIMYYREHPVFNNVRQDVLLCIVCARKENNKLALLEPDNK